MAATVERLEAEKDDDHGRRHHLRQEDLLRRRRPQRPHEGHARRHAAEFAGWVRENKALLRRLETLGKPVVAAINGAALGGGLEIALACHHRIVVDDPKVQLGLPEVQLGLLPGAGGVVRTVRMLGIVNALMQVLLQGQRIRPAQGQGDRPRRRARRHARRAGPRRQEVDRGQPRGASSRGTSRATRSPAARRRTRSSRRTCRPSRPTCASRSRARTTRRRTTSWPRRSRARRSTSTPRWRSRAATSSTSPTGQVAKNMIQAFFFDLQQVNGDRGRPDGDRAVRGQEGRRARRGHDGRRDRVRVREGRHRGRAQGRRPGGGRHAARTTREKLVAKGVERGKSTQEKGDALLARITADRRPGRRPRAPTS